MSRVIALNKGPIPQDGWPIDFADYAKLGVHATETTQRFVLGTRYLTWDGRVFKYSRSSGACRTGHGAMNNTTPFIDDDGATHPSVTTVAGDTSIKVAGQTVAEDALAGGYIIMYTGTGEDDLTFRAIIGNTVGSASEITIYLESPLTAVATADSTDMCAYYSPYYGLIYNATVGYSSVMGMPAAKVSATAYFFWVQSWGPCRVCPGAAGYGADANERQLVFGGNGSLFMHDTAHCITAMGQHLGFIIPCTSGGDDAPLAMLQISI